MSDASPAQSPRHASANSPSTDSRKLRELNVALVIAGIQLEAKWAAVWHAVGAGLIIAAMLAVWLECSRPSAGDCFGLVAIGFILDAIWLWATHSLRRVRDEDLEWLASVGIAEQHGFAELRAFLKQHGFVTIGQLTRFANANQYAFRCRMAQPGARSVVTPAPTAAVA